MPQYNCKLITANGDVVEDVLEAPSLDELNRSLMKRNEHAISIKKSEKFYLIRLVKWKALHDIKEHGIDNESLSGS